MIIEILNLKNLNPILPKEAIGIYDEAKYRKSQQYLIHNQKFLIVTSAFGLGIIMIMLLFGGFAYIDSFVREYTNNPMLMALMFFGILFFAFDFIDTPFEVYKTFVIEEKFGFNKTTIKTFVIDKIKGYFLATIIGGGLLTFIVWIYQLTGQNFWILAWAAVSAFIILFAMLYTSIIVPLFNKLTPLPKGKLRTAIEGYCKKINFKLNNIFVIDGSKRSTKTNAFFSGFGSKKKIVLYDTLIKSHSAEELVSVLAHEVGHYKKKHIFVRIIIGILQIGMMLFIFSLLIGNSFGIGQSSFHIDMLAFFLIYSSLTGVIGIIPNLISRKHEFEADSYAKETYNADAMKSALRKLASDNLSNLKPHPAYVFVNESHPPVLERLKAISI